MARRQRGELKDHFGDLSPGLLMAAVGLNAGVRRQRSNNGAKALVMALAGCVAAISTFIAGSMILGQS